MKKITFLGDIICEEPLLRASRHGKGYDFHQVFDGCREFFGQSDYVVGNLETPFAGKEAGYTNGLFSFNTPDEFAKAMAASGINMVTTATNHSLDRDKQGLFRTLDVLDQVGLEHIGAYRIADDRNRVFVKDFDGKRVAFLNYTYGTNLNESPFVISDNEYYVLNLLMPQKKVTSKARGGLKGTISKVLYRVIPLKTILMIKKAVGRDYANKYTDKLDNDSLREDFLIRVENDIRHAKDSADIVIACLHIGGQFNECPGEQVDFFIHKFSEFGVDYLINTHAHVVQRIEMAGDTFVANCLGNYSISPSSVYVPHELLPEYSVALHMYIDEPSIKLTFSILKIIEDKRHNITVIPVCKMIENMNVNDKEYSSIRKDVTFIYNRFTGKKEVRVPIQLEYPIEV